MESAKQPFLRSKVEASIIFVSFQSVAFQSIDQFPFFRRMCSSGLGYNMGLMKENAPERPNDEFRNGSTRNTQVNMDQWRNLDVDIPLEEGTFDNEEGGRHVGQILQEVLQGVATGRLQELNEEVGQEELAETTALQPSSEGEYFEEERGMKTEPLAMRMKTETRVIEISTQSDPIIDNTNMNNLRTISELRVTNLQIQKRNKKKYKKKMLELMVTNLQIQKRNKKKYKKQYLKNTLKGMASVYELAHKLNLIKDKKCKCKCKCERRDRKK